MAKNLELYMVDFFTRVASLVSVSIHFNRSSNGLPQFKNELLYHNVR